ncbi:MAG: hypothetical protein CFE22_03050 [Cytophagaceae bacterium BCCC1]|nr:MAG: hypothetical protein CFE22_03050 [Cytophagaceae bacterium BCCC1]
MLLIPSCKEKELKKLTIEKVYASFNSAKGIYVLDSLETKLNNTSSFYVGSYIVENDSIIFSSQLKVYNYLTPTKSIKISHEAVLFTNNYNLERKISTGIETEQNFKKYIKDNLKFYLIDDKIINWQMLIDSNTTIITIEHQLKL